MSDAGPHIQLLSDAGRRWARKARVVKVLDSPEILDEARLDTTTIFRATFSLQEQDNMSPETFFNITMSRLKGRRPSYVEGPNEWKQKISEDLPYHISFLTDITQRFHAVGLKVAGFSNSTGCPEPEDLLLMQQHNFCGIDAWSRHAYWGMCGPEASVDNALRFLKDHKILAGKHPPILITECGRDAVMQDMPPGVAQAIKDGHGWDYAGWRKQGIAPINYAQEVVKYKGLLPSYVPFMVPFTNGANNQWVAFDTDELVDYWIDLPDDPAVWEGGMPWNRHATFDEWNKVFGGQGYNPNDAFGKMRTDNPDADYGVYIGSYRGVTDPTCPFIYVFTTTGIFWYRKSNGQVGFANTEEELPLS